MGTNYYAELLSGTSFHIGKSSFGWKFMFRGYPPNIVNSEHWRNILSHMKIKDEYGKEISYEEFWMLVWDKRTKKSDIEEYHPYNGQKKAWNDPLGLGDFYDYDFS